MLPKVNGIDILKEIKAKNIKAKVLMLTAKSELDDKLLGFNMGVNDYLTKPFHMDELVARVNAQLRTSITEVKDYLEYGDIRLYIKKSILKCTKTDEEINIINKEFLLLEYFLSNPNQIISKEQIYDKVWGIDNDSFSNNLEAFLSFIRKKLKIIGSSVNIKMQCGTDSTGFQRNYYSDMWCYVDGTAVWNYKDSDKTNWDDYSKHGAHYVSSEPPVVDNCKIQAVNTWQTYEKTSSPSTWSCSWSGTKTGAFTVRWGFYNKYLSSTSGLNSGSWTFESGSNTISLGKVAIYNGSSWINATPYVYNGSQWKMAQAYVYNGSSWVIAKGV